MKIQIIIYLYVRATQNNNSVIELFITFNETRQTENKIRFFFL